MAGGAVRLCVRNSRGAICQGTDRLLLISDMSVQDLHTFHEDGADGTMTASSS